MNGSARAQMDKANIEFLVFTVVSKLSKRERKKVREMQNVRRFPN